MINYFSNSDLTNHDNVTLRNWVLVALIVAMFLLILVADMQLGIATIHETGSWGRSSTQVIMQSPAV